MLYDKPHEKKGFLELMADHTVVAPCVYDCVSAKLCEEAGFEAMCLSGGELAASLCGFPDIGLVTQDELVGVVERIASCTEIPMIVDIDTGFGNEINLIRTCKRVAHAGAKAVHLEDQTFPKRCGHLKGKTVIPREDYISKIKAAAFALEGTGCILIARTDAYHTLGLDEAIARCNEAIDAGASVSFIEGCGSLEDIEYAGGKVKGHKMFAMLATGASPAVTYQQCVDWGYSLVTLHCGMRGAIRGMRECYARVFEQKSDIALFDLPPVDPKYEGSGKGMFEMFGLNEWLALGKKFNPKIEMEEHLHSK